MQKEGVGDVKQYAIPRSGSSRASRGSQRRPDFVVSRNRPRKHWTAARVPVGLRATSVRARIASVSVPDRKNLEIIPAPNLSCYIVAHSDQDQLQLDRKDDRSAPSLLHRPADDVQVRDEVEAGAAGGGTMPHQHRGALADAQDGSEGQSRNRRGCRLAW